jgi:hypothetical protein
LAEGRASFSRVDRAERIFFGCLCARVHVCRERARKRNCK